MMVRLCWLAVGLLAGCDDSQGPSAAASVSGGSSPSAALIAVGPKPARLDELRVLEHRRHAAGVTPADLAHRDLRVRRAAARSLARIADVRALPQLTQLLHDEDATVVAWSAYGLGLVCTAAKEPHTVVRALVTRAASGLPSGKGAELDPVFAVADGLARCGGPDAERSLRSWLDLELALAKSAALALTRLAARTRKLEDATVVALLDAASSDTPLAEALGPLGLVNGLAPAVKRRLLEVSAPLLKEPGARAYTVRALSRVGDDAASTLHEVAIDPKVPAAERIMALRGLGEAGPAGQDALLDASKTLAASTDPSKLLGSDFALILTLVKHLEPSRKANKLLETLATLTLADAGKPSRHRAIVLRCAAASALANTASLDKRLAKCDPDPKGTIGARAKLEVLDRGPLRRRRLTEYLGLLRSEDRVVREAALRLLAEHAEVPDQPDILASALQAEEPGVVATAAEVLALHPERASRKEDGEKKDAQDAPPETAAIAPEKAVIEALTKAFDRPRGNDEIELLGVLIDAAAALQLLAFKPRFEELCKHSNTTVRSHAEKAIRAFGDRRRRCTSFEPLASAPPSAQRSPTQVTRLELQLTGRKLHLDLDPQLAPVTVAHVVELANRGFYDGLAVHRVVPGFVVQLGDPHGDGYGGSGTLLLCETTPQPFEQGGVGLALAGRDTGSSQLFVTLDRYPRLDGSYPLLGRAGPGWDQVVQGEVIERVRVVVK